MRNQQTKNGTFVRRTALLTVATVLILAACDTGDEYNEDGQLIEKTDVRVTGVDLGRIIDSTAQTTDGAEKFLPSDTVYASVHTKGASPQTILGVRWQDSTGFEVNGGNTVIRPTGDTSTLFYFHHMTPMQAGRYTLDVRVNGKVVKTRKFVVTSDAEPRSLAPSTVTRGFQPRFAGVKSFFTNAVAKAADLVESMRDRGDADQSPFEWRGMRGGMSFTKLDRITSPAAPWNCTPFLLTTVGLERGIPLESTKFGAGHVRAIVDTVGKRVVDIGYSVVWMKRTDPQIVEFERELTLLARKWDDIPEVIRHPAEPTVGPYLGRWETADSSWKASISYYGDKNGVGHPEGFEIEEIHWDRRVESHITDSLEAQLHNPESDYYRKPNLSCTALLQKSK